MLKDSSAVVSADPKVVNGKAAGQTLALKLKLTLLTLGLSPKELCGRFASLNPSTVFTPQNAYKWMSGKSVPRVSQVYNEWALVLGGELKGAFIAAASFEEFATALSSHRDVPRGVLADLLREAGGVAPQVVPQSSHPRPWSASELVTGRYLALSPAWSHVERGKLILGQAEIVRSSNSDLAITYSEELFGRSVHMDGSVFCDGRTAQAMVVCREDMRRYFFALEIPPPPANVMAGIFAGPTLHDFNARPTASRIVFLRAREQHTEPSASGLPSYLPPEVEVVDRLLAHLGYGSAEDCFAAAESLIKFLLPEGGGTLQVTPEAYGDVSLLLDKMSHGRRL